MLKWLLACYFILSSCSQSPEPASFVKTKGTKLELQQKPFYIAGTNQYYLFYKSKKMVDEVIEDAAALKLNTLRTWGFCNGEWKDGYCFQPEPRIYHEPTFKKMDYTIYKASQHGIKLIIPFVNNWDDLGGMMQYVRWSPTAEKRHDVFYTDPWTKQLYKDYVYFFLNRVNSITGVAYKNDPTILMWELTNEMRADSDPSGKIIQEWTAEMAAFIKGIDSYHLLTTGMEGFGRNGNNDWLNNGSQGTNYISNHQIKDIDMASFHLYPEQWGLNEASANLWVENSIRIAKEQIGKPVFCGEFGTRDKWNRKRIYTDWYATGDKMDGNGMMFWLLSGHQDDGNLYPDYDGYTIYYPEDTEISSVIYENSVKMARKNGI